jgi:hypothetical protein
MQGMAAPDYAAAGYCDMRSLNLCSLQVQFVLPEGLLECTSMPLLASQITCGDSEPVSNPGRRFPCPNGTEFNTSAANLPASCDTCCQVSTWNACSNIYNMLQGWLCQLSVSVRQVHGVASDAACTRFHQLDML